MAAKTMNVFYLVSLVIETRKQDGTSHPRSLYKVIPVDHFVMEDMVAFAFFYMQ